MTQLLAVDLAKFIAAMPVRSVPSSTRARLVYDGASLTLYLAEHPDRAVAWADTRGPAAPSWEVTSYASNLANAGIWVESLLKDDVVDVSPFWDGSASLVFTSHTAYVAFPVLDHPSGPRAAGAPRVGSS
ncbi:hypothetical protein [Streptomyces sp. NPDC004230]